MNADKAPLRGEVFQGHLHGSPDVVGLRSDVGVEEARSDDLEGQAHHLFVYVDCLAIPPAFDRALRETGHHPPVGGNPLAVEGRLSEPPLPPSELALAGQKPFAEQAAVSPEEPRLGEISVVLD